MQNPQKRLFGGKALCPGGGKSCPLLAAILVLVVVLGFFLSSVSIILMTAPIILPPLRDAGFDLIWFGVMMTIVMEMGIIQPQHLRHQKHRAE